MATQTHLIFQLNELQYGIETTHTREIFQLPELIPMADAPGDIIGILNFRGTILPVMHLAKRLGQEVPTCQLSDSVIVIEWHGFQIGMVVTQVHTVQELPASSIESAPTYDVRDYVHTAFVTGVAKLDESLVVLLNPETLIRQTDDVAMMVWEAKLSSLDDGLEQSGDLSLDNAIASPNERVLPAQQIPVLTNFFSLYCPNISPADRQIFRQRAIKLRHSLGGSDASSLLPLAVIELEKECFGVNLQQVREFINVRHVMPIPCCPSHIMGNMNLRGEVMTLLDIRGPLNLAQSDSSISKAVVIEVDDIVAGITVDQVLDVVYLTPSEISAMPTAIPEHCQVFFQGATQYFQKTLSILDLSKILNQGGLIVDQAA
ncbi:MAG: chemotaxis protein CheW [Cyanobacteria bacterium P01_H01_bin.26]